MVTFVPSWRNVSSGEMSRDDLIGPIQSFKALDVPYRIVVTDYMPHLRYFLHRFGLLESDYVSLFDKLQGFESRGQSALQFEDLDFPEDVSYTFTPFSVLVYQEGEQIGEIIQSEGAHISEVKHFRNSILLSLDIYDDRGFLSSRKIFENNQHSYTEYLDNFGHRIFVEFQKEGECLVNVHNSKDLQRDHYSSIEDIIFELLDQELLQGEDDVVMVSVYEGNKKRLNRSLYLDKMVLSYFSGRVSEKDITPLRDQFLLLKSRAAVVDSDGLYDTLCSVTEFENKVVKISPFDTRFRLSISQELKEEVLYFDLRRGSVSENETILRLTLDFIQGELSQEESRVFKIVLRTNSSQSHLLETYYRQLLSLRYPEEISLLEMLDLSSEGENSLDEAFLGDMKQRVLLVQHLLEGLQVEVFENDDALFKILHETRLLIDLSPSPDLFTQIAGISSGIPQINSSATDYVVHKKNGWIIDQLEELPEILSYYLNSLKPWQEARVYSVQQIKYYSGSALNQKLQSLFRGEQDG